MENSTNPATQKRLQTLATRLELLRATRAVLQQLSLKEMPEVFSKKAGETGDIFKHNEMSIAEEEIKTLQNKMATIDEMTEELLQEIKQTSEEFFKNILRAGISPKRTGPNFQGTRQNF